MNADVVTENLTVLNRHIAHMAKSAIQSATSSSSSSNPSSKSVEECGQLMSLWRPIMCRTSQMFPPPIPRSAADPASTASYASDHPASAGALIHHNNNNNNNHHKSKCVHDPPISAPATNSKSIPVHCVVMNTATPCYLSDAAMICSAGGGVEGGAKASDEVDVDSYAIIPASTLFTQIVPVVLRKLGYSDDVIFNATGWLMMKNWRPLSLTQIASSDRDTVGGVLGELTTVATLRIYIRKNYSSNGTHSSHQSEMKNKVLRWLMTQSQHLINTTRFPLDEQWQQKVMRGERPNTPSPDARRQFDVWFQQEMVRPSPTQQHQQLMLNRSNSDKVSSHHSPVSNHDGRDNVAVADLSRGDVLPPRVRMRTTFDPEQELPRLQRWFSENQHPTRFQLQLYVQELNELESRRGRKPLDVSNLVYWFKNARAAYKRAEVRSNNNQNESNADGGWAGSGQSIQGCLGEESSDDNRRLDDDDLLPAGSSEDRGRDEEDDRDDDDDDCSSVSDRSAIYDHHPHRHSTPGALPPPPLKMEPLDLNRSSCDDQDKATDQLADGGDGTTAASALGDPDDDDMGSQQSDSDSELEDYAENLSLSKHASDGGTADGCKKSDPLLQHNTSGSSSQSDYATAAAAAAAYPGFPLSLSHAQLNPHGLVYMTSPYLQGIGSSLLHQSGSAAAAAAAAAAHHLHHHHRSGGGGGGGLDPLSLTAAGGSSNNSDDRRKRNRTFIDPVTEVPRLEHWFSLNTHPSHSLVLRYTEELNRQPYRLKFPKLEPKNVQFWFKNRRAKCKRLKLSL